MFVDQYTKCLGFVLFVWDFLSHSRIFHSFGDITITAEGLQILSYAWHSWPVSSEGSLTCHTYCDTGQPFIMVISKDPVGRDQSLVTAPLPNSRH